MTKKDLAIYSGSPLSELFKVRRFSDITKRFDDLWKNWDYDMQVFMDLQPKTIFPKVNVAETSTSYEVEVALAGFEKEDINIELKDNCLYIMADRKEDSSSEDMDKKYLMREISSRSFRRVLNLPKKVVENDIDCFFKDGTLKCLLKKEEEVKAKNDSIKILIK